MQFNGQSRGRREDRIYRCVAEGTTRPENSRLPMCVTGLLRNRKRRHRHNLSVRSCESLPLWAIVELYGFVRTWREFVISTILFMECE